MIVMLTARDVRIYAWEDRHDDHGPRRGGGARRCGLPAGRPGVYRFRDATGQVLYLGRVVALRRRVASYWGDLGDRAHLAPMVAAIAAVEAVVCDSAHEAAWLERNLLREELPPWNRVPDGGQESEVWIHVAASAREPGLRVTHRPPPRSGPTAGAGRGRGPDRGGSRGFGPYLGGQRARLAVSGLSRLFPLEYTAEQPAGTLREMARCGASPRTGAPGSPPRCARCWTVIPRRSRRPWTS
jgi:excinuclease ABC subunit C